MHWRTDASRVGDPRDEGSGPNVLLGSYHWDHFFSVGSPKKSISHKSLCRGLPEGRDDGVWLSGYRCASVYARRASLLARIPSPEPRLIYHGNSSLPFTLTHSQDVERTNHHLIEDSHDKVFASLLMITDGQQLPPSVPSSRSASSGTSSGPKIVTTSVVKGEYGIGLDLVKSSNGRPCIQKLKEMPAGVVNPASLCNPPIQPGDIIVGVNGKPSGLFSDTIKIIRGLENGRPINLQLERGA